MIIKQEGKIGYALGGGIARGLFHIGVLNILEKYKIYPDIIVGTSMGAIIGALYASGLSAAEIKQIAIELDWKQIIRLADISLPLRGLIQGKRIQSLLKSVLKDVTFHQLKRKFACVATDLTSGEQVVLQDGSLIESIRASISVPAIFTPVKINGHYLVDGGLVNVVPISVCRELGADFVIGVNVIPVPGENLSLQDVFNKYRDIQVHDTSNITRQMSSSAEHGTSYQSHLHDIEEGVKKFLMYRISKRERNILNSSDVKAESKLAAIAPKEPGIAEVFSQALSIVEYRIAMENIKEADLAITPYNGNIGFWQFTRVADAITAGEIATQLALQRDDIARVMLEKHQSTIS